MTEEGAVQSAIRSIVGKSKTGPKHENWNGGKLIDGHGYVQLLAKDHPAKNSNQRVREHRLVMEAHLGRYLRANENIHHKNGVRTDNRLANLELWTRPQCPGQRVCDLVEWVVDQYPELVSQQLANKDFVARMLNHLFPKTNAESNVC